VPSSRRPVKSSSIAFQFSTLPFSSSGEDQRKQHGSNALGSRGATRRTTRPSPCKTGPDPDIRCIWAPSYVSRFLARELPSCGRALTSCSPGWSHRRNQKEEGNPQRFIPTRVRGLMDHAGKNAGSMGPRTRRSAPGNPAPRPSGPTRSGASKQMASPFCCMVWKVPLPSAESGSRRLTLRRSVTVTSERQMYPAHDAFSDGLSERPDGEAAQRGVVRRIDCADAAGRYRSLPAENGRGRGSPDRERGATARAGRDRE
jgi:hypothetical protein